MACSLPTVRHPPLTASQDAEAEGCLRLTKSFNSRVMGYCGPRDDYFFPLTGALSELAGVPFGSAELRRATSWPVLPSTFGGIRGAF